MMRQQSSIAKLLPGEAVWPPDNVRSSGIYWVASKGTGKSRALGRFIVRQDLFRGTGGLVIDPMGGVIDNLFDSILRQPKEVQAQLWNRIVYIDMGSREEVVPFPLYYRLSESEGIYQTAQRFVDVVRILDPYLQTASVEGWNAFYQCGSKVGMALAALGGQVVDAGELLAHTENYKQVLQLASKSNRDLVVPLEYLYEELKGLKSELKARRTASFLQKTTMFTLDGPMRAMFGADKPGINWQQMVDEGKTVLVDLRHVHDLEVRRFMFLWVLVYFLEFVKHRGAGRHKPVSLVIDELSQLSSMDKQTDKGMFAELINELLNVHARQGQVWVTLAHQEVWQVSDKLLKTLMGCGVRVVGRTSDMDAAMLLARQLLPVDPSKVKRYEPMFGSNGQVIHYRPITYTLEEQQYLASMLFSELGRFQFLMKSISGEGDRDLPLRPLDLRLIEPGCYPDDTYLASLRPILHGRTAVPVEEILRMVDNRKLAWAPEVKANGQSDKVPPKVDPDGYIHEA